MLPSSCAAHVHVLPKALAKVLHYVLLVGCGKTERMAVLRELAGTSERVPRRYCARVPTPMPGKRLPQLVDGVGVGQFPSRMRPPCLRAWLVYSHGVSFVSQPHPPHSPDAGSAPWVPRVCLPPPSVRASRRQPCAWLRASRSRPRPGHITRKICAMPCTPKGVAPTVAAGHGARARAGLISLLADDPTGIGRRMGASERDTGEL